MTMDYDDKQALIEEKIREKLSRFGVDLNKSFYSLCPIDAVSVIVNKLEGKALCLTDVELIDLLSSCKKAAENGLDWFSVMQCGVDDYFLFKEKDTDEQDNPKTD